MKYQSIGPLLWFKEGLGVKNNYTIMTPNDPDKQDDDLWESFDLSEDSSLFDHEGENKQWSKDLERALLEALILSESSEEILEKWNQFLSNLEENPEENKTKTNSYREWVKETPWIMKVVAFLGVSLTATSVLIEPGSVLSMRIIGVIAFLAFFIAWHERERHN